MALLLKKSIYLPLCLVSITVKYVSLMSKAGNENVKYKNKNIGSVKINK